MFGTRTFTVSALLVLAASGWSSPADYLPLGVGNQWVYRSSSPPTPPDAIVAEVTRTEQIDGRSYFVVTGFFGRDLRLRAAGDGTIYSWNPETRQEGVWAAFAAPQGQPYATTVDACSPTGVVVSRAARYSGPIGDFGNALEIAYLPGNCADAGISQDVFLPNTGLVRRSLITFAGPRHYDLVYARLGGVTMPQEQGISFKLTLDQPVYRVQPAAAPPKLTARITLRNTRAEPVELTFPSGQTYDLAIRNQKGETVWQWSSGRMFTQAVRQEKFGPGEKNWVVEAPLADAQGNPLPQGKYKAEAWLATAGPKRYSASVEFEVRHQ